MNKKCSICKEEKDISLYFKHARSKDGLQAHCKACKIIINNRYKENNPDKYKQTRRKAHIKLTYGVDEAWIDSRLEANNHKCPLCSTAIVKGKNLAVDHCHETGIVRDVICRTCNSAIGMFKDDPTLLSKAKEYLKGGTSND